jgi:hypothetical protein
MVSTDSLITVAAFTRSWAARLSFATTESTQPSLWRGWRCICAEQHRGQSSDVFDHIEGTSQRPFRQPHRPGTLGGLIRLSFGARAHSTRRFSRDGQKVRRRIPSSLQLRRVPRPRAAGSLGYSAAVRARSTTSLSV